MRFHDFGAVGDGGYPQGNLVLDGDGNMYGTTAGFNTFASGVVFEITP